MSENQDENVVVPNEVEVVDVPVEVMSEPIPAQDVIDAIDESEKAPDLIGEDEAVVLNKKVAAVAGGFFRALASLSDDEIYRLAYTEEGKNSPRLLEIVNSAFETMIAAGGDLPRIHFDAHSRLVDNFVATLKFNVESKLKANEDLLVAMAIGKTENPDRISHQDIINATSK